MENIKIRPYRSEDKHAVLTLNANSVHVLSPMDETVFGDILAMSKHTWVAEKDGNVMAFLIGLVSGADYASVNYQWFDKRLKNFFYVDRVVVGENARSLGIGRKIYSKLAQWAVENDIDWLAAEIDIEPPNPPSLMFHERQEFIEVARQTVNDKKTVSLQIKHIPPNTKKG